MESQISVSERQGRRRPPSVFDALMALSPPSPTLSLYSPTTCSSEEVPVLLFNPSLSDSDLADVDSRIASNYRSSIHSLAIPCSGSTGTIGTVGTFGQSQRRFSAQSQGSSLSTWLQIKNDMTSSGTENMMPPDEESLEKDLGINVNSSQCYERRAIQESLSTLTTPNGSQNINEHATSVPSAESPTAYMSPPSPSPSVYSTLSYSSTPRSRIRSQLPFETRPISYSDHAGVLYSSTSIIVPSKSCAPTTRTPVFGQTPRDKTLYSCPLLASDHNSKTQSSSELPKNLDWLRDIVVEMLIDQEGFRSVAPRFRFAGYSNNSRSLGSDLLKEAPGGIAEFVPVLRQTFNFHYAPFEGQPVLRRLTTNGEARDYISRQATLNIKSTGVYTVNGSETSAFLTPQGKRASYSQVAEDRKLHWNLNYFVDDKRGPRVLEGEKTFTPLTFCCSPLLLHPLQGKKIRLIHVVKKSMVTKLVAERMELPSLLPSLRLSSSLSNSSPCHEKEIDNAPSDDSTAGHSVPRPVSSGGLKQCGHILPPFKLSEMLDDVENTAPVENIHALTPPPRNFRKRI